MRCAFQARNLGIWEMLTRYENNVSPMRSVGPLIAVLSLAVAVSYASPAANAREAYIPFRSLVPNSWTLLPPDPQSYGEKNDGGVSLSLLWVRVSDGRSRRARRNRGGSIIWVACYPVRPMSTYSFV